MAQCFDSGVQNTAASISSTTVEVAVKAKLNCTWEEKLLEQKTTEVARELRKELLETANTFSTWPPSEQERLSKEMEIPN